MIESLSIRDFQCHHHLRIDFDERITTIVGRTDSGKSSILRAFKWVCTNRPAGDGFVQRGSQTPCKVTLRADEAAIIRIRGEGRNLYKLDGHVFKSFGAGVPEELVSLLALGPENFAGQHDFPFWFMLSPGEVSRELNSIVNLGLIDSTLANLATELRKARARIEVSEERLKEATERTTRLSWVREADADLSRLEEQEESLEEKRGRIERLGRLLSDLGRLSSAARKAESVLPLAQRVEELWEKKMNDLKELEKLGDLLERLISAQEDIEKMTKLRMEFEKEIKELVKDGCPICGR